jgi:hypothetical protein
VRSTKDLTAADGRYWPRLRMRSTVETFGRSIAAA